MLKITAPSVLARPVCTRVNENELDKNNSGGIGGDKINDKMVILSSYTKKMSSGAGFFTFKVSLAFTQLRKAFTKALILYYFDPKHHIQIKTDVLGYIIDEMLSQLTIKKGLSGPVTHKTNDQPINPPSEISQWYLVAFFS